MKAAPTIFSRDFEYFGAGVCGSEVSNHVKGGMEDRNTKIGVTRRALNAEKEKFVHPRSPDSEFLRYSRT